MSNGRIKRRRVAVSCVMCGEETKEVSGVCYRCVAVFDAGKKCLAEQSQRVADAEAIPVKMPKAIELDGWLTKETVWREHDERLLLTETLYSLSGLTRCHVHMRDAKRALYYDGEREKYYDPVNLVDPEKLSLLETAVRLIRRVVAANYQEGERRGQRILVNLASNKMSLADYNKI